MSPNTFRGIRHRRIPVWPIKIAVNWGSLTGSWGEPLYFSGIILINIRENKALLFEIKFSLFNQLMKIISMMLDVELDSQDKPQYKPT